MLYAPPAALPVPQFAIDPQGNLVQLTAEQLSAYLQKQQAQSQSKSNGKEEEGEGPPPVVMANDDG